MSIWQQNVNVIIFTCFRLNYLHFLSKQNRSITVHCFRMYPVVIANGRSLQSDAVINGYHIPKGVSANKFAALCIMHNGMALFLMFITISDTCHFSTFGHVERS